MRTNIFSLFLFIALPGALMAGEAKILSMSGNVEVRQTRDGQWISASENMEVAEGGAVRTGSDGAAVLLMPNKTKVWFKEATTLEIEQRQTLASRLALMFGKVKIRVPHLLRREKFEVRTPAAVCAVRGTEFTMGAAEGGKMDLQVLFGEVKLKFTVPQGKGKSEFNIPQGQGLSTGEKGKPVKPVLLTASNERAALENWNPGVKPEDRQNELKQKENDRAQVKEFAKVTNGAEQTVKTFLNVVKESDLEAGRTLNDVHGNLVRVDQRMVRPAPNEIQFFNLVKRPSYSNNNASVAKGGFQYNGAPAVTNRLDYMQMTMAFNKDLPQRIEEWPSFFNANSVDPSWASFVVANRTKADEIFFVASNYKFDAARDELVNNPAIVGIPTTQASADDRNVIITGVLGGPTALDGLNKISSLHVADAGASNGTLKYTDADGVPTTAVNAAAGTDVVWAIKTDKAVSYSEPKNAPDNAPLAQFQADMYDIGNQKGTNANEYLWFAKENYAIGNGGQIRTSDDFVNSHSDPFTLLKENALESVMYIKKSAGDAPLTITTNDQAKTDISTADYFKYGSVTAGVGTNIDIVFIPDLMVAAVQRMLPAITNLKD